MRLRSRQFLTYLLLATYAGISFLGEGLHELMPEAGHHHHVGLSIVHSAGDHADHDAGQRATSGLGCVTASDCDADSHLCEICAFLLEAISHAADVAWPIDSKPLVVATSPQPQQIHAPISLGPQAPRGPPQLLG